MNRVLARQEGIASRRRGRLVSAIATVSLWGSLLGGGRAWADPVGTPEPAPAAATTARPAESAALPPAARPVEAVPNPALDLKEASPEPAKPSLFGRWWFWTAVGAAAAATVAVIVVSSSGNAPPATDLGNQEFQP
jgi:hypothetical protein